MIRDERKVNNKTNIYYWWVFRRLTDLRYILLVFTLSLFSFHSYSQINTDRVMLMGRHALYYEDYVLSIQRFNRVIAAKPYLHEPYFFRGLAKFYLEDFTGAEQDCSESLQRNPYVADSYQLRGLCRVNLKDYEGAILDYRKVIDMEPRNKASWHNLVLCYFETKSYALADSALDNMIRFWPGESENLTMKAQVAIHQGDTVRSLAFIDSALVVDPYDAQAWTMRSMISLQRGEYAQAEAEIDKAIVQQPRVAGNYINRALARFHQNNLRGAMTDYDQALEISPKNYLGHFNRGLLRAQVGEDNAAIEDFNYVLSVEPDNMIALFNRALLLDNTGDYRGAIRDISQVLDVYPDFLVGYQQRSLIRRKIGDTYGAERDEYRVVKARYDAKAGIRHKPAKTRKQSHRDINDYASLVEADNNEPQREYTSAYRGKVQDHQVELIPQPIIVISHHQAQSPTNRYIPFHRLLESLNTRISVCLSTVSGSHPVYLTNIEPTLDESELQIHFAIINQLTENMQAIQNPKAIHYIARALSYYHVRDFEAASLDLEQAAALDEQDPLIPFLQAQVHCRQIEAMSNESSLVSTNLGYYRALDELERVVKLSPTMAYAWYNMGNLYLMQKEYRKAYESYSKALNIDARFPAAFYNRGLASLQSGNIQRALSDLSQAGEYGLYSAYNLIKRYSKEKKQ